MSVVSIPTHLDIAMLIDALIDPLTLTGSVEPDPEFYEDPRQYVKFVEGHGVVIEHQGWTPFPAGGHYETVHSFALHCFWSFSVAPPTGKSRAQAFAEMLTGIVLALHNSPRLGNAVTAYSIKNLGLENPTGALREQFDLGKTYYAMPVLRVGVTANC